MANRLRRNRRFRRGKQNYIWASVFVTGDQVALNGDTDAFPIVLRDDWARDPTNAQMIEKGAVLERIIGNVRVKAIDIAGATVSLGGASYIWGIGKFDEDDSQVLNLVTSYFGEDWMRLEAGTIDSNNALTNAFRPLTTERHMVDMNVKRKLTSEDEIRFVFGGFTGVGGSSITQALSVDYFFRSLIRVP